MAKTPEQTRDSYYRRKYGVGLAWYNARFEEQSGCCAICRRPQSTFKFRFAVDHDHGWKAVKITVDKIDDIWSAYAEYLGQRFGAEACRKPDARRDLKEMLKARSCRGLLCPFCNRGLRYYADKPERLANAAEYLRKHQNAR